MNTIMISNNIQIKRHYRTYDEIKVHKNEVLHYNANIIVSSDELECIDLLKFTINTIIGDQNQFEMGYSIIGQEISQEFKDYTYLLTGNSNRISWIARDITRGAMMQLVLLCCRLEELNDYTNMPIDLKLTSNEGKLNFVLNYIRQCSCYPQSYIEVLENALYESRCYLDDCDLDFNNEVHIHSLWGEYSMKILYSKILSNTPQYSEHELLLRLDVSSGCVMYNRHNYKMLPLSLESIKLCNYIYDTKTNRFLNKTSYSINGLLNFAFLSIDKSKISGECILETKSYIMSVACYDDRFIKNMTGEIFMKSEKISYKYIVDISGFIFYNLDSKYIGKSDYITNLEKNILESQLQTTEN